MPAKITTLEMECAIAQWATPRRNLVVPNVSWGMNIHECDVLILSDAGYATEVEIKISKADLKKERTKRHGHHDYHNRIKRLFFAFPAALWPKLDDALDCVPERAGILLVTPRGHAPGWGPLWRVETQRDCVTNKAAGKFSDSERYKLARLGALRVWGLKKKLLQASP